MRQATCITDKLRRDLGLLELAGTKAAKGALEVNGKPTDIYRVEASKMFNTPYDQVTEAQRRGVKRATFFHLYP